MSVARNQAASNEKVRPQIVSQLDAFSLSFAYYELHDSCGRERIRSGPHDYSCAWETAPTRARSHGVHSFVMRKDAATSDANQ